MAVQHKMVSEAKLTETIFLAGTVSRLLLYRQRTVPRYMCTFDNIDPQVDHKEAYCSKIFGASQIK